MLISISFLILPQCTMKISRKMTGGSNFCGKLWRILQMVRLQTAGRRGVCEDHLDGCLAGLSA